MCEVYKVEFDFVPPPNNHNNHNLCRNLQLFTLAKALLVTFNFVTELKIIQVKKFAENTSIDWTIHIRMVEIMQRYLCWLDKYIPTVENVTWCWKDNLKAVCLHPTGHTV